MADATPFFGIPPFVLGMTRETVLAAAGRPESVETSDVTGSVIESWFYQSGEIELEFDPEPDARLQSITIRSATATLNGVGIVGRPVEELPRLALQADIHDLVLTDEVEEFGQCYESDQHGLMFWVVDGTVMNVTIFPRFDDAGETPQWPE